MRIKGLIFDVNGTLVDISTDDGGADACRATANFLALRGVRISPDELREVYFALNRRQRQESPEPFPEFNILEIFETVVRRYAAAEVGPAGRPGLAETAALVFRASGCRRLTLYNGVLEVLTALRSRFPMTVVSDGQSLWAAAELRAVGLGGFFPEPVISGDYGRRKPDGRLFAAGLRQLGADPGEAVYIGNDMYRDIRGAAAVGMKTVFFRSNQGDHSFHGAEPDYIIYDFNELPRALNFLEFGDAGHS